MPTTLDLPAIAAQVSRVTDVKLTKTNASITTTLVSMVIVSEAATLSNVNVILVTEVFSVIVPSTHAVLILAIIVADAALTGLFQMDTNANAYPELGGRIVNKTTMTALTTLVSTENALMVSMAIR